MTELWSERAQAYRESEAHREGADLDRLVEWALESGGREALDVATGGGHVARRLREAGFRVVTVDSAPGMRPDVLCRAEELPFADASFDVVACRLAAHHFADPAAALAELARVARGPVLVVDNVFAGERVEEAERLRDGSHVRCYSEAEWRDLFEGAGLEVEDAARFDKAMDVEAWLARAGCGGEEAERVVELLGDRVRDGVLHLDQLALKGRNG